MVEKKCITSQHKILFFLVCEIDLLQTYAAREQTIILRKKPYL